MSITIDWNKGTPSIYQTVQDNTTCHITRSIDHNYQESHKYDLIDCQYYQYKIDVKECDYSFSLGLIPDLIRYIEYNYGSLIITERSKVNPITDFQIRFEIMGSTNEMNLFFSDLMDLISLRIDNHKMLVMNGNLVSDPVS